MPVYREKAFGTGVGGAPSDVVETDEVIIRLDNGVELRVAMFLDKDGNDTEILFDAVEALAQGPDGSWYDVFIQESTWVMPTLH